MKRPLRPLLLVSAALPLAMLVGCDSGSEVATAPDPVEVSERADVVDQAAPASPKTDSIPATPIEPAPAPAVPSATPAKEAATDAAEPGTETADAEPVKTEAELFAETVAARLAELNRQYGAERGEYYKLLRAQREVLKNDPEAAVEALVKPEPAHVERLLAAASDYAGTEHAPRFLLGALSVLARAGDAKSQDILATLLDEHLESEALSRMTFTLIYYGKTIGADVVQATIDRVVEGSPHDDVKAAMLYARGSIVSRNRQATDEQKQAALVPLERSVELAPESSYGKRAASTIFELTKLQIGMPAPDIEGNDLDGVAFKLSDYKGKVVLLDFWGDW